MPTKPYYPLALPPEERFKLRFGKYAKPAFKIGKRANDAILGEVTIIGVTVGKIPWPVFQNKGRKSLVLYRGLLRALQRESAGAVCYWWGVSPYTVSKWKQLLGIGKTVGTTKLHSLTFKGEAGERARIAGRPTLSSPERRAKISAAMLGKPRSTNGQAEANGHSPNMVRERMSFAARKERRERIVEALRAGEHPRDVAAREKLSLGTIKLCARVAGVKRNCGVMTNSLSATTYDILAGLLKGESVESLADRYYVAKQQISRIADHARRAGIVLPAETTPVTPRKRRR